MNSSISNDTDFQLRVDRFVNLFSLDIPVEFRLLDLVSETGELAKELLSSGQYGNHKFEPAQGWENELGDVFFSLICLANQTGVDLNRALELALKKYNMRIESKGEISSEGKKN